MGKACGYEACTGCMTCDMAAEIERLRTSSTLAEVERLTRERDALRAAVLGLLEYWHEDDMDQEYYEIAEKQALAALEQSSAPVRSTRQCEVCDGYHIIGSPCPVDGHRHT